MICIATYWSCIHNPTKVVEDLKAKLLEMMQDCGEYSNQYTPSFTIHHTKSVTATPDKPVSYLVTTTTDHIHKLSTTTCNEVYFPTFHSECNSISCQLFLEVSIQYSMCVCILFVTTFANNY